MILRADTTVSTATTVYTTAPKRKIPATQKGRTLFVNRIRNTGTPINSELDFVNMMLAQRKNCGLIDRIGFKLADLMRAIINPDCTVTEKALLKRKAKLEKANKTHRNNWGITK